MISKSLSTSRRFAALHDIAGKLAEFCQSLYPLLVAHSDDFGRQAGDEFTVKHAVCPTSPRRIEDVARALEALDRAGLIAWYAVDGDKFIQINDFDAHQVGLHKRRDHSAFPAPPELPGTSGKFPEIPSEQKGTEGKGTEENRREGADALPPLTEVATDTDPSAPECKVEAVVQLWNEIVAASKLPQCRGLSDARRKHIRSRMKEHGLGVIRDVFTRVAASGFANGQNSRGWVMTFDWLMESPGNFLKALEGKYDNRAPLAATGTDGRGRTGSTPGKFAGLEEQD